MKYFAFGKPEINIIFNYTTNNPGLKAKI